jgi:hypothetical protein
MTRYSDRAVDDANRRLANMGPGGLKGLGWLVSLVLMVTSLPAGCFSVTAYKEHERMLATEGPPPNRANGRPPGTQAIKDRQSTHAHAFDDYQWMLKSAIGLMIVHLVISTWGFLRPRSDIMGLRGTVIGVLCWSAFGVGIVLGNWLWK